MTTMDAPDSGSHLDRPNRLRRDPADDRDENAGDASSKRLQPWLLGLLGVLMIVFSAPPLANVVMEVAEQGLQPLASGGRGLAAGVRHLPGPGVRPPVSVHVSAFGRGDSGLRQLRRRVRHDRLADPRALRRLAGGDRALGPPGDRRQGLGPQSVALRGPVALHHRLDPQLVHARPAEPGASDAAPGRLLLPAKGTRRLGRGARGDRRGDQGVPDPGARLLRLPPQMAGLGGHRGGPRRVAPDRPLALPDAGAGRPGRQGLDRRDAL